MKDETPPPPLQFGVPRMSGRMLIRAVLAFPRPRHGAERSWRPGAGDARAGSAPPQGRASRGLSCARRAPARLGAGFPWRALKGGLLGVAGGYGDGNDPPAAAAHFVTNSPSARVANCASILPQTHTNRIKPNSFGRDAPCSPNVKAPPGWTPKAASPPQLPVPSALLSVLARELRPRPEGTWAPAARSGWAPRRAACPSARSSANRAPVAQRARRGAVQLPPPPRSKFPGFCSPKLPPCRAPRPQYLSLGGGVGAPVQRGGLVWGRAAGSPEKGPIHWLPGGHNLGGSCCGREELASVLDPGSAL